MLFQFFFHELTSSKKLTTCSVYDIYKKMSIKKELSLEDSSNFTYVHHNCSIKN
ncbi:hypothetical protein FM106_02880 [Brachybacterium faecium]|nr:hypothetical protein FM106_02880 [Brachybacterium faecium]